MIIGTRDVAPRIPRRNTGNESGFANVGGLQKVYCAGRIGFDPHGFAVKTSLCSTMPPSSPAGFRRVAHGYFQMFSKAGGIRSDTDRIPPTSIDLATTSV